MQKTLPNKNKDKKEKFDQFLDWLNKFALDSENPYVEIHYKLILFFAARRCAEAEDLADKTMDRVMKKVIEDKINYEGNPMKYFYSFANNIYLEYKRERSIQINEDLLKVESEIIGEIEDQEISLNERCLKLCLTKLDASDKKLLLEYYSVDSGREKEYREKVAKRYKLSTNSLRVKVFRLKNSLFKCIKKCLNK